MDKSTEPIIIANHKQEPIKSHANPVSPTLNVHNKNHQFIDLGKLIVS